MDLDLKRLRPKLATAASIRAALDAVRAEQSTVRQRVEEDTARLPGMFLTATAAEIRALEQSLVDDDRNLARLAALDAELQRQLTEAAAIEAGEARAQQVRDAAAKIEAFNTWMQTQLEAHGRAIAAGVELERLALRAIEALRDPTTNAVYAELPPIARAFVRNDARSLGFLTRIPAASPGAPFVWP
jgi:hypothetical protein